MQVVHVHDGEREVLASQVDVADSLLSRARGLMFRSSLPDDSALVFEFDGPVVRSLHMLFVPFAIDALWVVGDEVTRRKRLRPWLGTGRGTADTIVELPAGAAADVDAGDVIRIEE